MLRWRFPKPPERKKNYWLILVVDVLPQGMILLECNLVDQYFRRLYFQSFDVQRVSTCSTKADQRKSIVVNLHCEVA